MEKSDEEMTFSELREKYIKLRSIPLKQIENFRITIFTSNKKYFQMVIVNQSYLGIQIEKAGLSDIRGAQKLVPAFIDETVSEEMENEIKMRYPLYMGRCPGIIERLLERV